MHPYIAFPALTQSLLSLERIHLEGSFFDRACYSLAALAEAFRCECFQKKSLSPLIIAKQFRLSHELAQITARKTLTWESSALSGTLLNKSGSCLGLTTLFIAVGEIVGFSMRAALFEGHITPVFQDGKTRIFIDPTRCSCVMHEHSIQQLHGNLIKVLTKDEFCAIHLANQAILVYVHVGLMDDAVFLIDSALEMFPDYTAGWINRASMMKKLDNASEMHRSLEVAKALNPGPRYTRAIEQIENSATSTEKIA